jgi:hypothetical protein
MHALNDKIYPCVLDAVAPRSPSTDEMQPQACVHFLEKFAQHYCIMQTTDGFHRSGSSSVHQHVSTPCVHRVNPSKSGACQLLVVMVESRTAGSTQQQY